MANNILIEFSKKEYESISRLAQFENLNASEFVKAKVLERTEENIITMLFEKAYKIDRKSSKAGSFEEAFSFLKELC